MTHGNSKLTDEQQLAIVNEFRTTTPSTAILANKYNVSIKTIRRLLNKHLTEFNVKSTHGSLKFTELQRLEIIKLYLSEQSCPQIAKLYNCHPSTIRYQLLIEDIDRRDGSEMQRIYKLNQEYFSNIDNEEKAYWLGFIAGDGYVNGNDLVVNLAKKDKGHLEKLLISLNSDKPIYERLRYDKRTNRIYEGVAVKFSSKKLVSDLKKLKIIPNKSLVLEPSPINSKLLKHYYRGLVDADGHLANKIKKKNNQINNIINLVGSYAIVESFIMFLNDNLILKHNLKPQASGKIFTVTYGGNQQPIKIAELLYKDAHIFLSRKNAIANKMINSLHPIDQMPALPTLNP